MEKMLRMTPKQRRMSQSGTAVIEDRGLRFLLAPSSRSEDSFAQAVESGLSKAQRSIPSRFLYDVEGSRLFERIMRLPEYYLTRSETEILERYPGEIIAHAGEDFQIVEFGSGNAEKTRLLLRAAVERQPGVEYVPIDISTEFLRASAEELLDEVDELRVTAIAGDYLDALRVLPEHGGSRLFLFLGSTIGNFEKDEAVAFLAEIRRAMRPQDRLLVGADLRKSPRIIEPAYNDAEGVTEQFDRNVLARINRDLCGHFDLSLFEHLAPWIEEHSRIEMRLVSARDQEVAIDGIDRVYRFARGEFIHTENSHKWSSETFAAMCREAGLSISQTWHDANRWFAVHLLSASAL